MTTLVTGGNGWVPSHIVRRLARRGDPIILGRDLAVFAMAEGTKSMTGFDKQFSEHAEQARAHGEGHRLAVAANSVVSQLIVLAYRLLRFIRRAD